VDPITPPDPSSGENSFNGDCALVIANKLPNAFLHNRKSLLLFMSFIYEKHLYHTILDRKRDE